MIIINIIIIKSFLTGDFTAVKEEMKRWWKLETTTYDTKQAAKEKKGLNVVIARKEQLGILIFLWNGARSHWLVRDFKLHFKGLVSGWICRISDAVISGVPWFQDSHCRTADFDEKYPNDYFTTVIFRLRQFKIEQYMRAISLLMRQDLKKHLNIYVLNIVYLPFCGVLQDGRSWFPQCSLWAMSFLFCFTSSFTYHCWWINEGENKRRKCG